MRSVPHAALSLVAVFLAAACTSGGAASPSPAGPTTAQPPTPPTANGPSAGTGASAAPSASAGTPTGGAPATTAELAGRTFIVTAADGYTIVNGSTITFRFEGGQVGISAGCNQMSGAYELTDGVMKAGAIISTEMACAEPLMAQDAWIGGFVNGATLTLDGPTLVLANGGITLTATDKKVAQPDRPLAGTTWVVDGLVADEAVSSVPAGVTATLVFGDGRVSVVAGCNTGGGPAELGDTAITFGPIGTTKMACDGAAMAVERHVLEVLQGDVAWAIDSDSLTLTGAGGGLTLKARA